MDVTVYRRVRNKDYFQQEVGQVTVVTSTSSGGGGSTTPAAIQAYAVNFSLGNTVLVGGLRKLLLKHNKNTPFIRFTVYNDQGREMRGIGWHPSDADPLNIAIIDLNQIISGTWKIFVEYYIQA